MNLAKLAVMTCLVIVLLAKDDQVYSECVNEDEQKLLLFYGSFDANHDSQMDPDEMAVFFEWCRTEITYEAHNGYQSPLETFTIKNGDCLDISLLFANFLCVHQLATVHIGDVAVDNKGKNVNHACCLLKMSREDKDLIQQSLGYKVSYFKNDVCDSLYVVIDPLSGSRFGKVEVKDYRLKDVRSLRDFKFNDMPSF